MDGPLQVMPLPAQSAGGAGQGRFHKESERSNFSREEGNAKADGGEVRVKQIRRNDGVCMCMCVKYVILVASWLLHMHQLTRWTPELDFFHIKCT